MNLDLITASNGVISDYEYDDLNRLDTLTHYRPDATPDDLTDNAKLAQFDYTVLANGSRSGLVEQFWTDDNATSTSDPDLTNSYAWNYDAANRLIDEVFWTDADNTNGQIFDGGGLPDTSRPLSDYHDSFRFDLAGNRLARFTDLDPADPATFNVWVQGDLERDTRYEYDANDRLVTETFDFTTDGSAVDGTVDRTTTYDYGETTQQLEKAVFSGPLGEGLPTPPQLSNASFSYNLQGRLSQAVTETFTDDGQGNDVVSQRSTATYEYGTDGIRIRATNEVATDDDSNPATALVVASRTETEFLVDKSNDTGYQQVLVERTWNVDENGTRTALTKHTVYTLGHDLISQTDIDPVTGQAGETYVLLYDGHGSTRTLANEAGNVASVNGTPQVFHYDAYGAALGFSESAAATSLLYSGEQFDQRVQMQYLRARFYDQSSGRFNRLDPFFGNINDPLSLHKYLYSHADPVDNIDPTGLLSLGSMTAGSQIGGMLNNLQAEFGMKVSELAIAVASGATAGSAAAGIVAADLAIAGLPFFGKAFGRIFKVFGGGMRHAGRFLPRVGRKAVLPGLLHISDSAVKQLFDRTLASTLNVGDSQVLRKSLESLADLSSGSLSGISAQIHHIIPKSFKDHRLLRRLGFNIDHALNALPLKEVAHLGSHPKYNDAVERVLNEIQRRRVPAGEAREMVLETMSNATAAILDGNKLRGTLDSISENDWYRMLKPQSL